jgi:hypothetical protein
VHDLSVGEIIATVMFALFAMAFGAWAKRLDKALDLLEKIQADMHTTAIRTERRLTRLEGVAEWWASGRQLPNNHLGDDVSE